LTEREVASAEGVVSRANVGTIREVSTGGGISCSEEMVDEVGGSESVVVTEGIVLSVARGGDIRLRERGDADEAGEAQRDGVDAAEKLCAAGEWGGLSRRSARLMASARRVACWLWMCASASSSAPEKTSVSGSSSCSLDVVSAALPGVGGGEWFASCEGAQPSVMSMSSLMTNQKRRMGLPSLEWKGRMSLYAERAGRSDMTLARVGWMTGLLS
jgi:hypothetical protein